MRKYFIILLMISCLDCFAQQEITITDTTLLKVIDLFIDSLNLQDKKYRVIRIEFRSVSKDVQVDKELLDNDFTIFNTKAQLSYRFLYSFSISYEKMDEILDVMPPGYYSFYKKIPIIINTGFENFIRIDNKALESLKKKLRIHFNQRIGAVPIMWFVKVADGKIHIEKLY